jgi:hypothetical protein
MMKSYVIIMSLNKVRESDVDGKKKKNLVHVPKCR